MVMRVMMGMIDGTSSEVRIRETYGGTARMIPPMSAHVGIDVEFAPTARKWTAIRFCPRVGVYVNFHAAGTVETFSAVGALVLLSPAFALESGAGDV
jgi:hypothetical protein